MKTVITISSQELNEKDVHALLQAVRDCEIANFPDKNISIIAEVPELSTDAVNAILTGIKPPFKYGPMMFKRRE